MDGLQTAALVLLFVLYLFLSVFRSAYATLTPVALKRLLAGKGVSEGRHTLGIRIAFDAGHHLVLVTGSILVVRALQGSASPHPFLWSAAILAGAVLAAQVLGRVIALAQPERAFSVTWVVASMFYGPLDILARPLFSALERLHLASRRDRQEDGADATSEEIEAFIDVGRQEGILEVEEGQLIQHVVEFHDAVVREVMTPRTEIVAVPATATLGELHDLMAQCRHSRVPVFRDQIDVIEGVVHLKDLLGAIRTGSASEPIGAIVKEAFFVPETKQVADLLREFQARKTQIAVVVDEYGGTAGVVTVEDLLEEIVGEIQEEQDLEEPELSPEGEGRFLVRGTATVDALNEALGTDLPAEGYETVAGLIYNDLGRIPRAGEVVTRDEVRLEVLKADNRRINLVRAVRRDEAAGAGSRTP